jgi:hypothetical protein
MLEAIPTIGHSILLVNGYLKEGAILVRGVGFEPTEAYARGS